MGHFPPPSDTATYDEFGFLPDVAEELALQWTRSRHVSRNDFELEDGQNLSYLRWGTGDPRLVFLHGGGQNAHTWDGVLVAMGTDAIAVDLPGHGRSDRRDDRNYSPWQNALAVAELMEAVAPSVDAVIGMSLGGATAIRLAAKRPDLMAHAVIVDVTPQVNDAGRTMTPEQRGSVALIGAAPSYPSYEEMVATTLSMSPNRTEAGIRRGVRHNAVQCEDGSWIWRYDLVGRRAEEADDGSASENIQSWVDFTPLWDDVAEITVPTLLVQGGDSVYVLPEDVTEFTRRLPSVTVEVVPGAGHAVQSDQPLALAELIERFAR